ncbi:MAG: zinc ABC transporter substrate-binding protein [Bacteroidales bacterium]|nr:zinc ABC transporter substrate-binding protein [Bacteroidales bacterium]
MLMIIALLLPACKNKTVENEKPSVAVSILPQEYFVKKIAGDLFQINVMIPPGASPATYEPTPAQLTKLSGTETYLKMGYTGFEMSWMEKISASNGQMKIYNLSEGIDLITEGRVHDNGESGDGRHHGGINPHTWLSPVNARIIAKNIHKALSAQYPGHKEEFGINLDHFLREVDSLDRYISSELSSLGSRAFFTYHPSLSYFSRDYGLEQYPLELGGKTPSSAYLKSLIDTGLEKNIGVVFLQMQFDQKNAEVLAREIDAVIVQINPLDSEWFDQMVFITKKLKENLQ